MTDKVKPAHPTKVALLATASELLDTHRSNELTVEMICSTSGISLGSLYHHYLDLGDLVDHAIIHRFARYVDRSIEWLDAALNSAANADEFFVGLRRVTRGTQSRSLFSARLERAGAISRAGSNDEFLAKLGAEQQRLTDELTRIVQTAQDKGWVTKRANARASAVFIQAYTLGRLVDDITPNPVDDETWIALIDLIAETVFAPASK